MHDHVKKYLILLFSFFLSIMFCHAETELTNVKNRYDKRYDFSRINTKYAWTQYEPSSRKPEEAYDEEINTWIIASVNKKLASMGYQEVSSTSASFGIDYHIVIDDEGSTSSHVKRGRGGNPYTYSNVDGMPSMKNWRKGTLLLNIVNPETGYVIWVGKADAIVVDKKDRKQLIEQAIDRLLEGFPP